MFTILTCEPNEFTSATHNRMPVMLPEDAWPIWLGETGAGPEQLWVLYKPFSVGTNDFVAGDTASRQREEYRCRAGRAVAGGGGLMSAREMITPGRVAISLRG